MKKSDHKILVIGIGNNGRQDDGLGWEFLDRLQELSFPVDIEYRYQLQIEDAELISKYDRVIFIDACKKALKNGFDFYTCIPTEAYSFSTHALQPETILYLTRTLYHLYPETSVMAIQGYEWELKIGLTPQGNSNLTNAMAYFKDRVLCEYLSLT